MPSLHKLCRMVRWRYAGKKKKFNVSSTRGRMKNPESVQILRTSPILPIRHVKDWIVGNAEQRCSFNKWSSESEARHQELVPAQPVVEMENSQDLAYKRKLERNKGSENLIQC